MVIYKGDDGDDSDDNDVDDDGGGGGAGAGGCEDDHADAMAMKPVIF